MFDIGFSELLVIAVVALIVIGPERLPTVARTLGHLFGRMQRYVNDVKADIAREMELEELRRLQASVEETARSLGESVERGFAEAEAELGKLAQLPPEAESRAPAEASAAPAGSGQLELGLEAAPRAPARERS